MVKPGRTKQGLHTRTSVDQARKSDRAKELKKHKKERANIRLALAKSGSQRSENIEKLLELERQLCGLEEARFHENVLRQKQKVLLAGFDKSRAVFQKSDKPEDKASLERLNETIRDYYTRCNAIRREAEMMAKAKATVVDDIPMPEAGEFTKQTALQPMPVVHYRTSKRPRRREDGRRAVPPGVPVGMPPEFSDSDDDQQPQEHDDVDEDDLGHVFIPAEICNKIAPVPPPVPVMMPLRGPPLPPPPVAPSFTDKSSSSSLSAAPVMNKQQPAAAAAGAAAASPSTETTTIAAQPQLRDLKGESTSLVPAQLRRAKEKKTIVPMRRPMAPARSVQTGKTTDEAYDDFMKELDGLL